MIDMGIEPGRYIVGNQLNSKNPITGQPEFFLKKIGRRLRKAARYWVKGRPRTGAFLGALADQELVQQVLYLGQYKRENPGDPTQALAGGLGGLKIGTNKPQDKGLFWWNLQRCNDLGIGTW